MKSRFKCLCGLDFEIDTETNEEVGCDCGKIYMTQTRVDVGDYFKSSKVIRMKRGQFSQRRTVFQLDTLKD